MDWTILLSRVPSFFIVIAIFLPNILFLFFPPKNIPPELPAEKPGIFFEMMEKLGQAGITVIPFFYELNTSLTNPIFWIAISGMLLFLAGYYIGWIYFFIKGRGFKWLFFPLPALPFIPLPLAVYPIMFFLFASLLLKSVPLAAAALILAAGHIPISLNESKRCLKAEESTNI